MDIGLAPSLLHNRHQLPRMREKRRVDQDPICGAKLFTQAPRMDRRQYLDIILKSKPTCPTLHPFWISCQEQLDRIL